MAMYHFSGISVVDLLSDAIDDPGLCMFEVLAAIDGAAKGPEFNLVQSIGPF
jgi:hypothetical protein